MYQLQRIKSLYKYTDGDVIDAGMGVQIDPGYGLVQYWDEQQGKVVNTDFSQHPAILYPFPYSSKRGQYVVPSTQGQQWYYNNPDTDTAGILDETGAVKDAYKALFEVTSVVIGTLTFPALRIKGNLATANDHTDKRIYYKSSYNGKNFTCCQLIPVQTTVGDATDILISVTSADGSGTNVLSNTNSWVQLQANLQRAGVNILSGATFQWQKLVNGLWQNVTNQASLIEVVDSKTIKVYGAYVDSEAMFRVTVTYNGATQYKMQQLTDTADTYYIFDGCDQPAEAVPEGVDVHFTPVVYDRRTNDPDLSQSWYFAFQLVNLVSGALIGGKTVSQTYTVTSQTLDDNQGVNVVIMASNDQATISA